MSTCLTQPGKEEEMSNFWIWIDTALIVAIITLIGAIIQVFGPAYLERRKARRKESEGSQA